MQFELLFGSALPSVTAMHPGRPQYVQDADMKLQVFDLSESKDSQHPQWTLHLPIDQVCKVHALQYSSDGRYLFAIVISLKQVHILAWDFSEKVPRWHSSELLP